MLKQSEALVSQGSASLKKVLFLIVRLFFMGLSCFEWLGYYS